MARSWLRTRQDRPWGRSLRRRREIVCWCVLVKRFAQGILLDKRQDVLKPALLVLKTVGDDGQLIGVARGKHPLHVVQLVHRQRELLDVVGALTAPRRRPSRLHRRQQERDQNANDGDDDQKLDKCKTATLHERT